MESPAMVAMPVPMCKPRSGSFALQGTSLAENISRGQHGSIHGLLSLALGTPLQKHTRGNHETQERLEMGLQIP